MTCKNCIHHDSCHAVEKLILGWDGINLYYSNFAETLCKSFSENKEENNERKTAFKDPLFKKP